jgi:hypothetical protein
MVSVLLIVAREVSLPSGFSAPVSAMESYPLRDDALARQQLTLEQGRGSLPLPSMTLGLWYLVPHLFKYHNLLSRAPHKGIEKHFPQ